MSIDYAAKARQFEEFQSTCSYVAACYENDAKDLDAASAEYSALAEIEQDRQERWRVRTVDEALAATAANAKPPCPEPFRNSASWPRVIKSREDAVQRCTRTFADYVRAMEFAHQFLPAALSECRFIPAIDKLRRAAEADPTFPNLRPHEFAHFPWDAWRADMHKLWEAADAELKRTLHERDYPPKPPTINHQPTGGRPALSPEQQETRIKLLARWKTARDARCRRENFCKDEGITVEALERFQQWAANRRSRAFTK